MRPRPLALYAYLSLVLPVLLLAACHTPVAKPEVKPRVIGMTAPSVSSQIAVLPTLPDNFDNSTWQLLQVNGHRTLPASSQGSNAYLSFVHGQLTGNTGCNTLSGLYQRQGLSIDIERLVISSRQCPAFATQEQEMLRALEALQQVRIIKATGYLALLDRNVKLLAELAPVNLQRNP